MSVPTARSTGSMSGEKRTSKRERDSHSTHQAKGKGKLPMRTEKEETAGDTISAFDDSRRAPVNLYDAVAGRLHYEGFILDGRRKPAAPDEVLFRRTNAPTRYEEDDKYFANRNLPPHVKLPDSDLLKALHAYVSDFYASANSAEHEGDYQSMDETALLAMGVLLEEACGHALGKTGDLAFVEGERRDGTD